MGAETVNEILNQSEKSKVTIVNRGRSWDWDKLELLEDKVTTITHDRRKPLSQCKELVKLSESVHFDAVIDFSGFEPFMVQESVRMFGCNTDVYIYISSDSVYEVCINKTHSGPTKEEDAIRPEDKDERTRLSEADDYGDEKLQCEECIQDYRKENDQQCCRFVILRLADVLGPKDSTDRWWQYQTWLKLAIQTNTRVQLPIAYKDKPLSFVYVKDVSKMISKIVFGMTPEELKNIANQPFNLACQETPTLDQLICDIHRVVNGGTSGSESVSYHSDSEDVRQIYPSVERGPIDISKATALLGWDPTPWEEVVRETVQFYEKVCSSQCTERFLAERQDFYKSLKTDLSYLYTKKQLQTLKDILSLRC